MGSTQGFFPPDEGEFGWVFGKCAIKQGTEFARNKTI